MSRNILTLFNYNEGTKKNQKKVVWKGHLFKNLLSCLHILALNFVSFTLIVKFLIDVMEQVCGAYEGAQAFC